MTHVASLKFQGGGEKKLLEILYNVMQRGQSATIKELIADHAAIIQQKEGISVK